MIWFIVYNRPYKTFQDIQKELCIDPIKIHGLRKTYATRLFENGVPPKTVQTLMGHTGIETTLNIYTEVMDSEKVNDIFNI